MLLHQSCKVHSIRDPSNIPCYRGKCDACYNRATLQKISKQMMLVSICQVANVGILSLKSTTLHRLVKFDHRIEVTQSRAHSERRHRKA
jgi:hypothetical protein